MVVSTLISRNTRDVVGSSVFWLAVGIPRVLAVSRTVARCLRPLGDSGGAMMIKLSR